MICPNDGNYTNATVIGVNGGKVPLCDDCIGTEPYATYTVSSHIPTAKWPPESPSPVGPTARGRTSAPGSSPARPSPPAGVAAVSQRNAKGEVRHTLSQPRAVGVNPDWDGVMRAQARGLAATARPAIETAVKNEFKRIMGAIVLELPEPPAANRYLRRHGNITYKTREAKAYCKLVATLAHKHRVNGGPAFPTGDVTVVVVWHRSRKAGDLGERTKVLYDALQGTVYADDKQIAQDWRRRCDEHASIPAGHMRVEVSAA